MFVFLAFAGVGASLLVSLNSNIEFAKNTELFQSKYLSAIQYSIDLSKSLTSYDDFLYDEIKSPRQRDASIFTDKIKSSFKLLVGNDLLSSENRNKIETEMNTLFKKGEIVSKHIEAEDYQLARKFYETEYADASKAFLLELDSNKKYLQNQATRFFSKNIRNSVDNATFIFQAGVALVGFAFAFFVLMYAMTKRALKKERSEVKRIEKEKDEVVDRAFENAEIIAEMRRFCKEAMVNAPAVFNVEASGWTPRVVESFRIDYLMKQKSAEKNAIEKIKVEVALLEKGVRKAEESWNQGMDSVKGFQRFKRELINNGLKGHGLVRGSELLEGLEELEKIFSQNPFSLMETKLEEALGEFLGAREKLNEAHEGEINRAKDELEKAANNFEQKLAMKQQEIEEGRIKLTEFLTSRNELLAQALVMTDSDEVNEEEDSFAQAA